MSKYTQIAEVIVKRIAHGDYAIGGLPGEEKLAAEMGASRMTARKALEHLAEQGVISRGPGGRRQVNRDCGSRSRRLQVAFLAPAYVSQFYQRLRSAAERVVNEREGMVRPIEYVHVDDAVVYDAIEAFDAIFFIPQPEPMPARLIERLADPARHVVAFGQSLVEHNVLSIDLMPPAFTHRLLDHLGARGCRKVDCFNVQQVGRTEELRMQQWKLWLSAHQFDGELIDEPVPLFEESAPHAYARIRDRLERGYKPEAIFCITEAAAIGASRALSERGLTIGRDVMLCTIGEMGITSLLTPSITSLLVPDPKPYLRMCLDWMSGRDKQWVGPRLLQPPEPAIFVGESTGDAPVAATPAGHTDSSS